MHVNDCRRPKFTFHCLRFFPSSCCSMQLTWGLKDSVTSFGFRAGVAALVDGELVLFRSHRRLCGAPYNVVAGPIHALSVCSRLI